MTYQAMIEFSIDLGKNTLRLIGMDHRGRILLRRKVSSGQLPFSVGLGPMEIHQL